jgi:uncharacterized iron-regulated protein
MQAILLAVILLCATSTAQADFIRSDDGRAVTRGEVLAVLAEADFILLGERHDNSHHHSTRAELINTLVSRTPTRKPGIVMEYLDRGARLDPQRPLLEEMQRAGFSDQGWQWPLHEPLFTVARAAGLDILGGNLKRADARRIAMRGEPELDAELAAQLTRAPLTSAAQQRLDDDLNTGHCGHLPAARLPNMRLAQRARDAAMATALLAAPSGRAVLLAGNGHVRHDYGVAPMLRQLAPSQRSVSIGFFESGPDLEAYLAELRGAFDFYWITPPVERDDPCAGFKLPPVPR